MKSLILILMTSISALAFANDEPTRLPGRPPGPVKRVSPATPLPDHPSYQPGAITYDQLDQQQKAEYQQSLHAAPNSESDAHQTVCFRSYLIHLYTRLHGGLASPAIFHLESGSGSDLADFTTRDQWVCKLTGPGFFIINCINAKSGGHYNFYIDSYYLGKHMNQFRHCGGN